MKKGHHPGASVLPMPEGQNMKKVGDRILVMGATPGRVITDIPVDRDRPRTAAVTGTPEYRGCKEECLARIRAEVRSSFGGALIAVAILGQTGRLRSLCQCGDSGKEIVI